MRVALQIDTQYLLDRLLDFAAVDTSVPLGYETFIEPDAPKLVHYTQRVLRPDLAEMGLELIDAPLNNLIVRLGKGRSNRRLLIQTYTVVQHHNLMEKPLSPEVRTIVREGTERQAIFAQGVGQAKGHQAVMFAVLRLLRDSSAELDGTLFWAINNEGQSSHRCSMAIFGALDHKPSFNLLQIDTGLSIVMGNRGRADINVHVHGKATHSSDPSGGLSAIEGACRVVDRLARLNWETSHPLLGKRHAIVYKVRYEPLAPHTLPEDAYITVDRRLLPGDDASAALEEVRDAIGDLSPYRLSLELGPVMLPSLVDRSDPWIEALIGANRDVAGRNPKLTYPKSTFDCGGGASVGIPSVMYGAGGHAAMLEPDFVFLDELVTEADVLATFIMKQLS